MTDDLREGLHEDEDFVKELEEMGYGDEDTGVPDDYGAIDIPQIPY